MNTTEPSPQTPVISHFYRNAMVIVSSFIFLILVAGAAYMLGKSSNNNNNTPVNPSAHRIISGMVVGISETDVKNVKNVHKEFNQKFLILDMTHQSKPDFYALNTSDSRIYSKMTELSNREKIGTCVDVTYTSISDKSLQNSGDYVSKVKMLTIQDLTLREDMNCLKSYSTVSESIDTPLVDITARILPSVRPDFDIGYDYTIAVPGAEAKKIGYTNSSGLEIKDSESVEIFLVAKSSLVLQKIEAAKRAAQPVIISGKLQPGFAESTFLLATNIRPIKQAATDIPSAAPTAAATKTQKKVMIYHLPDGWKTASDSSGSFEVGYDPNSNVPSSNNWEVEMGQKGPLTMHHYISLKPYDGGSRHNFIYKQLNVTDPEQNKIPGYYESDFVYNGWSCLVLHGFGFSASGDIQGMCAIDSTRAFFFVSIPSEDVVRTVRLLK